MPYQPYLKHNEPIIGIYEPIYRHGEHHGDKEILCVYDPSSSLSFDDESHGSTCGNIYITLLHSVVKVKVPIHNHDSHPTHDSPIRADMGFIPNMMIFMEYLPPYSMTILISRMESISNNIRSV